MEKIILTVFDNGINAHIDTGRYHLPCGFFHNWSHLFAVMPTYKDTLPICVRRESAIYLPR